MNKGIHIPVDFMPDVDDATLDKIEAKLQAIIDKSDIPLDLHGEEAEKILEQLLQQADELQPMLEQLEASIDVDAATRALDDVTAKLTALDASEIDLTPEGVDDIVRAAQAFDELEQSLLAQKKALAVMVATGREGTEEFKALQSVVAKNEAQFNQMKSAVENAGKAMTDLGNNGSKQLNFLALSEAGEQLEEVFGSIVEKGKEYNDAAKQVQAQTGLTGEAFKQLKDDAKDVFVAGVGESAAEALKIMGTAQLQFGKVFKGEELKQLTISLGNTAKAFDKDFGEIASRASVFQKSFNLDATSTANLVAFGLQNAKTSSDDFLDSLAEFSPLMKEAGLEAEEFVGILARADGTFSTAKIADGIKELGIRLKNGDVQTGINDLIVNFGQRIPDALTAALTAVAEEGQAGIKSTAQVLQESTAAIEEAFSSGAIDKNIRGGLQAAFAGAPAEEMGADLYARVFSAPIDTSLVEAQAAAAQAQIDKSFQPSFAEKIGKGFEAIEQKVASAFVPLAKGGQALADIAPKLNAIKSLVPAEHFDKLSKGMSSTFSKGFEAIQKGGSGMAGHLSKLGPIMFGPWGIALAAVVGLLALFFTQTEEGKEIFSGIQEFFTDLYEQAKPALEAIGSLLGTIGKVIFELIIAPTKIAWAIVSELFSVIADLFSSGEDDGGDGMKEFFDAIVEGAQQAKIYIEGFVAAFKAVIDNIGPAIKALVTGDFAGFVSALGNIGEQAGAEFQKGVEAAASKIETAKLQAQLTSALEVKGNLDKNNAIGDLVNKYKNAKDEITKQNLAAQIAAQVPGAVNSVTTVVDAVTGKVSEVYDIAIDKAADYVAKQNEALTKAGAGGEDAFFKLLVKQTDELDKNKEKLQEMATEIANTAAKGGDVTRLTEKFEAQKEATEKSAEGVRNIVVQGKGLGVTAASVEKMAKESGKSADETTRLAGGFRLADQEVRKTSVSAKVLGDAFAQAMSRVDGSLNVAMQGLAGAQLKMQEITNQLKTEKDPAKIQLLKEQFADLKNSLPEFNKQIRQNALEQVKLQETTAQIAKNVENTQKSKLARNQTELAQSQAQIELTSKIFALREREARIVAGREENTYDQLRLATNELTKQTALFHEQTDALNLSRKDADAILKVMQETGDLDIDAVAIKLNLRVAERDGKDALKLAVAEAATAVYESKVNVLDINTQLRLDSTELQDLTKEIEQKRFDIDVELGIAGPGEILERMQTQLERVREKANDANDGLAAINARLSESDVTAEERLFMEQKRLELLTKIEGFKLEEIDLEHQLRSVFNENYDLRAAKAQETFDIIAEKAVAGYDQEQQMVEAFVATKLELETEGVQEAKQAELDAIEEVAEARSKALDEAQAIAEQNLELLQQFGQLGEDGIDTERELQQRRLDITKEYEEKRKAEAERVAKEKEAAEREAVERSLALQKIAEGEALAITRHRELAELRLQQAGLAEQVKIAEQKAELSGLKADRDAADTMGRELDRLNDVVEEKGSVLQGLTGTLKSGLSDSFATLFSGNEEAIADSFRSLFGVLGGALKKLASTFVVDIVLGSPWIKSAIGINPLLGAGITAGVTGLLTGLVGKLLDPVLAGLTSFASGGRIDSPMLALVGDARKLGGSSDREWIFRDEQLWQVVAGATNAMATKLVVKMDEMIEALMGQRFVGVLEAGQIRILMQYAETQAQIRQRE